MTPEERFNRIEMDLAATGSLLAATAQTQARTQEALHELTETIGRYITASDARMKRMEENLDLLIRAITAEHSDGKQ